MNDELRMFRTTVRQFIQKEFAPHQARWREQHRPRRRGLDQGRRAGILLPDVPEEYGGGGGTFAHEAVVLEELAQAGVHFGSGIQSIVAHYILAYGSEEQKRNWLPRLARGELVGGIAMTEPGAGSDLQAIKTSAAPRRRPLRHQRLEDLHHQRLARRPGLPRGEDRRRRGRHERHLAHHRRNRRTLPGYRVGRPLEKVGMHGQDTCELFFDDVRVPARQSARRRAKATALSQMMEQLPYERLSIGVGAVAMAEHAVDITTRYVQGTQRVRQAADRFAEHALQAGRVQDRGAYRPRLLDTASSASSPASSTTSTAAMAKYWLTERQCRDRRRVCAVARRLRLHERYPIARMWADSRVQRIYAGTNEIMKELIAWSL